jgi:aspartate aminotransferase
MTLLSQRILDMSESETIAMSRRSRELKAQGIDVVNLSLGEPDFPTPDFIKEAAKKAIDDNYSYYPPVAGYADLRQAVAHKFERDNGLFYTAEQIVVSTGAKQSIANAILSLINPGDEVIVPAPFWVTYIEIIKLAGGVPIVVQTGVDTNFKFTPEQIEAAITPRTKMLMYSSPCNPTGMVLSRADLQALAAMLGKHPQVVILSDEIYEHINFVGRHESIAQFAEVKDRTVVINGVSKGFAMTGWRIGFMAAPLEIAKACDKMQGQFTSAPSSIAQRAALAAVQANPDVTIPMRQSFEKRKNLVMEKLAAIPGFICNQPEGAFYVFPDISFYFGKQFQGKSINTSAEFTDFLIENAHVSLVPGSAFGSPNCLRFSYATSEEKLLEAISRIDKAVKLLA